MSLMPQLKTYLQDTQRANIVQISQHLQTDVAVTRDLLACFMRKGYVCRRQSPNRCGACQKCNPLLLEVYEWVKPSALE